MTYHFLRVGATLLNGYPASLELGFGSASSIHRRVTLPPAQVSVPVVIITFHKYPLHKLGVPLWVCRKGKVGFWVNDVAVLLYLVVVSSTEEQIMCWPSSGSVCHSAVTRSLCHLLTLCYLSDRLRF